MSTIQQTNGSSSRCSTKWVAAVQNAIDTGNCRPVRWCLKNKELSDNSLQWGLQELVRHASEVTLKTVLQLQLHGIQLDSVLSETVTRGLWSVVRLVLRCSISGTMRAWAVKEAIQHAGNEHLESFLPHCTDQQRDCLLTEAVTRGLWDCVQGVMRYGTSDALRQWVVVEASKRAGDHAFSKMIPLGDLTTEENWLLLKEAVARGLWQSVIQLLCNGVPQQEREWVFCEASKRAPEAVLEDVFRKCLYRCERVLDEVLVNLLSRDFWKLVKALIPHRVNRLQTTFIVSQARWHADSFSYQAILKASQGPVSADLDVTRAVKHGQWRVLVDLLNSSLSAEVRRWAIEEALKYANKKTRISIIKQKERLRPSGLQAGHTGCLPRSATATSGSRSRETTSVVAENFAMPLKAAYGADPQRSAGKCLCRTKSKSRKRRKAGQEKSCLYHTLHITWPVSPSSRWVILSVGRSVAKFSSGLSPASGCRLSRMS